MGTATTAAVTRSLPTVSRATRPATSANNVRRLMAPLCSIIVGRIWPVQLARVRVLASCHSVRCYDVALDGARIVPCSEPYIQHQTGLRCVPKGAACPRATQGALQPITSVAFAGISKTYPNTVITFSNVTSHKIFTDVATVARGETYPITLKGNTGGAFVNRFLVFIDWNQNNILDDAGELYFSSPALSITGSTGLDAISAMVGYTMQENITFAYSYDFTMTNIKKYSTGTHELMIGIKFHKVKESKDAVKMQ